MIGICLYIYIFYSLKLVLSDVCLSHLINSAYYIPVHTYQHMCQFDLKYFNIPFYRLRFEFRNCHFDVKDLGFDTKMLILVF